MDLKSIGTMLITLLFTVSAYAQELGVNVMFTPGGSIYALQSENYKNRFSNYSITGKVANIGYRSASDALEEQGRGLALGAGVRFYKHAVKDGIYLGAGIDAVYADMSTVHHENRNDDSLYGIIPIVEMGYSFKMGKFKIEPNAIMAPLSTLNNVQTKMLTAVGISLWHQF